MKKAEEYINAFKGRGVFEHDVMKWIALEAIKQAQKEAIREMGLLIFGVLEANMSEFELSEAITMLEDRLIKTFKL